MPSRRTTALGVVLFAALVLAATFVAPGSAGARAARLRGAVPQLLFPVVGPVTYRDDFGEPRGNGKHQGNDLMSFRLSPAVAAEAGKIKFWTTSARAGCMLYLYGKSGTTYLYVHLNNDLTDKHDNRGKCVAGVAYAPGLKDGASVQAGQQIGFVGDSGDAVGNPHLHFEVHPNDGVAVSPYPYLRKAVHLLVPVDPKVTVSLSVEGKVARSAGDRLTLAPTSMTVLPGTQKLTGIGRTIVLAVPSTTQIDVGDGTIGSAGTATLAELAGRQVVVLTTPAKATLPVALARPGAISASRIATTTHVAAGGP